MFTKPIGVFFGSTTGNTEDAAQHIAKAICDRTDGPAVKTIDICGMPPEKLLAFDVLILGCPTWDEGQLQSDWNRLLERLGDARFDGKKIALFGSGDAASYPETFQDAMGILGKTLRERGATLIGAWPTEGYNFEASKAVENGKFLGLALDIANSGCEIRELAARWAEQLVKELDIS